LYEHSHRNYTYEEILNLVKSIGILQNSNSAKYLGHRFYWRTKDISNHNVRLVITFEEDEGGQLILVISAGERT
jgi:hypothetical protein